MSLLQIAEPSQSTKPHQHKFALGIDLGTTRSLIAVVRSGKAQIIEASEDEHPNDTLLPSVVYYGEECPEIIENKPCSLHAPLVGSSALEKLTTDTKNTIVSAKRFMGRSVADIKFSHPYQLKQLSDDSNASEVVNFMPAFVTKQGEKTPVEVSAEILSTLRKRAKKALSDDSIQGAVITVPAYFDEAQRQATKDAAKVSGIKVLRLLNEPTAAAVAYGLDKQIQKKPNNSAGYYLIYDLGGGTFDVSILRLNNGVFEVLATGGNSALGGDDIDRLFANWMIKQAGKNPNDISVDSKSQLARLAKDYKQQLTDSDLIDINVSLAEFDWTGVASIEDLHTITEPVTKRTLIVCEQVLRDAKLNISELDDVILVGGSTRMPIIQSAVETFFAKTPLCSIDPDKVVALGAAQAAQQLITEEHTDDKLLLLDVTPLSLGLETMGGLVEVIVPRNTPIPVSKRQVFTTYQDGQNGMVIHVVQGERETVENNRSLAKFVLNDIPPMKAGLARIEVTFSINADGQLTVSAEETTTGTQSQIDVIPSYGLSDAQKESLLISGFNHASEDKDARRLIEAQVEAEREVLALESALNDFSALLNNEQKNSLTENMQNVRNAISLNDLPSLLTAQAKLTPLSDDFASLIMNQSVKTSMAGTKTEDWQ